MSKKTRYEIIRDSFENKDFELLTVDYINNKQKLDYICPMGHKHAMSWADWNSKKVGCPYCNGRPIITIEIVRQALAKEGYILLTTEYINNKQRLDYICPKQHLHHTTWAKWNSHKYRCPYCYGNTKKNIEDIKENFEKNKYTLVTDVYINCYTKLHSICPNGHDYFVTWDNWSSKNSRCPKCNIHGVSREEIELFDFINDIYPGVVVNNDYSLITPKEIDIVVPDRKMAIEYCGLYWHSEMVGKDKDYHLNKLNSCAAKGYTLTTIFSDEFTNRGVVFNKLRSFLNYNKSETIYGKDCTISEVTAAAAICFYEQNEFQIDIKPTVGVGIFYNSELISIMLFKELKPFVWELLNFCSDIKYNIIDGFKTLLNYFENNYTCQKIITYEDRRWPTTINYNKFGFEHIEIIEPSCWYIKKDKRVAKVPKKDQVKSISKKYPLNKIWDCGYLKHVKINTT